MTQSKLRILDQFKDVTLYTWDNKYFQVDIDSSCIFNSFDEESAWNVFEDEAQKRGSQYVKDLTKENLVAPRAGAWIETTSDAGLNLRFGSRPVRARGLKRCQVVCLDTWYSRAPCGRVD